MTSTNRRLILYVNPEWRRPGIHTPFLNPWWGNPYEEAAIFPKRVFDTYSFDTNYYGITDDIKEADMVLPPYPHNWFLRHNPDLFQECIQVAEKVNLPLLIDGLGDIEHPIDTPNAYILRYSGYRFLPDPRRVQLPLLVDDLLERYRGGHLDIRPKSDRQPVVGFAGWSNLSVGQYWRTLLKELPVRLQGIFDRRYQTCTKGIWWRKKSIKVLENSSQLTTNFRIRSSFSGNPKTVDDGNVIKLQEEMVDVILQSDYALDVRGDANNSARLFEILALGRIPVIIDTERNFPFSDKVDYSSFALIVDWRDLAHLPDIITRFHNNISPTRFEQMQKNARQTYLDYFRVDAIMPHIVAELREKI